MYYIAYVCNTFYVSMTVYIAIATDAGRGKTCFMVYDVRIGLVGVSTFLQPVNNLMSFYKTEYCITFFNNISCSVLQALYLQQTFDFYKLKYS